VAQYTFDIKNTQVFVMTFNPIMFARHSNAASAVTNAVQANNNLVVMDFSGSETSVFLSTILGLDLTKLTASGLGLKGTLDGDLNSDYSFAVYYFSETAFRFVLPHSASLQLQALINEQQLRFDIDYVLRSDLATLALCGENAFDTLISAFKLTPGLRLSNPQLCYGAQSGEVFITAIDKNDEQHFVLVAKQQELLKWQQHLQAQGFALMQNQAA
jgi:aminomethyltransferase